jgi:hypothetical protein
VGIERPEGDDVPRGEHPDRPGRPAPDAGGRQDQPETRFRQEAYLDLRAVAGIEERTEPSGRAEPGARSKPLEPTEHKQQPKPTASWEETADLARWMWGEYKRKWPPEERPPVDRSSDTSGSWRGESGRFLRPAANAEVDEKYDSIADREENSISPRLREVESCDPYRHLAGFDDRLKGRDRIKEKVAKSIAEKGLSLRDAISRVPDAIRYTFQYEEARYTQGVLTDVTRMKEQGFKLDILKNSWSDDQYKGINSQWIEPDTGQHFEVQFHTRISFEAKQITHSAYERLRTQQADKFEQMVLEAFQGKVTAEVPVPPNVADIPDYPEREQGAR